MKTRWLLVLMLAFFAPVANATFHTFRIDQLYSNADGTVQFVVLREVVGSGSQNQWAGRTLRMTGPAGVSTLIFPANLPSADTALRAVLVATPGFAALGLVAPDYTMPAGFLALSAGTLNFAGVNQVTYMTLPTDGTNALSSAGVIIPNVATNFAGVSASVIVAPPTATVIEYFNAALDHYFITILPVKSRFSMRALQSRDGCVRGSPLLCTWPLARERRPCAGSTYRRTREIRTSSVAAPRNATTLLRNFPPSSTRIRNFST